MAIRDLENALASIPFYEPMGLTVESAEPGEVVLKLPADRRTRDFTGHVASGALFAAGELAATVVLSTHPALGGRPIRRRSAHIAYLQTSNRPVRAVARFDAALLQTLDPEDPVIEVTAELQDRNGEIIAEVTAYFGIPLSP